MLSNSEQDANRSLVAVAHAEAVIRVRRNAPPGPPAIPTSLDVKAELGQLGVNMPLNDVIRLCRELVLALADIHEDGEEPTRKLPAVRF